MNLKGMSIEELKTLMSEIKKEIESRSDSYSFTIETEKNFDKRGNGHAYLAKITKDDVGKVQREFIDMTFREYDNKGMCYYAKWDIKAKDGDCFEARINSGWKKDYKNFYKVENGSLIEFKTLNEMINNDKQWR